MTNFRRFAFTLLPFLMCSIVQAQSQPGGNISTDPNVFFEVRNCKIVNDPEHPAITYDLYMSVSESYVDYVAQHGPAYGIQGVDVGIDIDFGSDGTIRSGVDTIKITEHTGNSVNDQVSSLRPAKAIADMPEGDFDASFKIALLRDENDLPLLVVPTHIASLKVIFAAGTIIGTSENGAKLRLRCHATGFGTKANSSKWGDFRGNIQRPVSSTAAIKALPVTLSSFDVIRENSAQALLSWVTTEETNSDRFEIEKSLDGKKWKIIGIVSALGESSVSHKYSAIDDDLTRGDQYYRLHMIDKDGSNTYSRIRMIKAETGSVSLVPNPASDQFHVGAPDWGNISRIRITNLAGMEVYDSGNDAKQDIDVRQFPAGMYIVEIVRKNGIATTHKLWLAK
ncbi:T9SS type A sorting domain-containing protein [Dyadobacter endophyticus]|uniref:T9SS type A sorting domain-containing protein n=1 Tax=Dyadobacter endophyticus TaxID=1749036 RepID=UPI003CF20A01